MSDLDDIVRRLSAVTDQLLALEPHDFANRFRLKQERDDLRAEALSFREGKDERRSIFELQSELTARRSQLDKIIDSRINMLYQAQTSAGSVRAISEKDGGTINNALMRAQGSEAIISRIAELEQELTKRGLDPQRRQ